MYELDEKTICITVVGRTGAGKTSWISSLVENGEKLREICRTNQANSEEGEKYGT